MKITVLKLDPRDNVLIALQDLRKGDRISFSGHELLLASDVPAKHKFVIENLKPGGDVIMYGVLVGKARESVQIGEILTPRNTIHEAAAYRESSHTYEWSPPDVSRWLQRTFLGYRRPDGQVGTRNYWLVVPLVFCENRNVDVMKQAFEEELGFAPPKVYRRQVAELVRRYRKGSLDDARSRSAEEDLQSSARPRLFEHVDGIKFLMHEGGCGGTREDYNNLCGLIAGYIHHPNVAGATVLSLGCQHSQIGILREQLKRRDGDFNKPLLLFEQQQSGSEFKMLSEAIQATFLGFVEANKANRAPEEIDANHTLAYAHHRGGFRGNKEPERWPESTSSCRANAPIRRE